MSWTRLLESLMAIETEAHKKEPDVEHIIKQTGKGKQELETLINEKLGLATFDYIITPDVKLWVKRNNLIWKAFKKIHLALSLKFPNDSTVNELGQIIKYYEAMLE